MCVAMGDVNALMTRRGGWNMSSPVLHLHSTMTHNGALESIANAAPDITMFDWPSTEKRTWDCVCYL